MNLDAESLALAQITHLVSGLTRKNSKSSVSELRGLVLQFGFEAERHLLKTLFNYIDCSSNTNSPHNKQSNNNNQQAPQITFLIQLCESVATQPHFTSLLCYALSRPLSQFKGFKQQQQQNVFACLARALRLSPLRSLAFAAAGSRLSPEEYPDIRSHAHRHLKDRVPDLIERLQAASSNEAKRGVFESELCPESLILPISGALRSLDLCDLRDKLIDSLQPVETENPENYCQQPQLGILSTMMPPTGSAAGSGGSAAPAPTGSGGSAAVSGSSSQVNIPEVIRDIGYPFTLKQDVCRATLGQLAHRDNTEGQLHAQTVARIIGVMIRTHTGLDDPATLQSLNPTGTSIWEKDKNEPKGWNMEVFINAVSELQPTLHWKEITFELDHPGFIVKDRQALILLIQALKFGFAAQGFPGPFPVDLFYRTWKNTDSQVSLFQQILRNPDVFSFGDFTHHPVAIEVMKTQPEVDREVAMWRSLELLDTLLNLAENGHPQAVMEMLSVPKSHCPDVLTLGLMQINPPLTSFRSEILSQLMQIFLNNHPNASVILSYAWHSSSLNLKGVLIHSMADWYTKAQSEGDSENNRLSRILDVAQDLKALSVLLSAKAIPFVVDLAVMAARREYLNLEKWLNDQLREHHEAFAKLITNYLKRKFPPFAGQGATLTEDHFQKANLAPDVLITFLLCLQNYTQTSHISFSQELKESLQIMLQMSHPMITRFRAVPPPPQPQPQPQPAASVAAPAVMPPRQPVEQSVAAPRMRGVPMLPQAAALLAANNDPLNTLSSHFSSMNFQQGPPPPPPPSSTANSNAFSLPNVLGPIVRSQSPSARMFAPPPPPSVAPPAADAAAAVTTTSPAPVALVKAAVLPPSVAVTQASAASAAAAAAASGMQSGLEQIRQGNISQIFPELPATIPKEVEDKANSYFQRIYNVPPHPTLTIPEVLDLLKKFQESTIQQEKDVFNCMLKNLFEEYKYFPQYPQKELHITAQLFGGIIEQGLVTMIPLGIALRFVLDALRKPADTNMYFFGITALDCFKTRLKDYRQYCQHITCIDHFKNFPEHLIEWVEHGVQQRTPPTKPQANQQQQQPPQQQPQQPVPTASKASSLPPSGAATSSTTSSTIVRPTVTTIGGRPSIANTTNIDTLLNAIRKTHKSPGDKIQDRVAFIFNNLSLSNMQQKAEDLCEYLSDEYLGWLSNYLVVKRASIEPNFHTLYSQFLETLRNAALNAEVLHETYHNIHTLLALPDKGINNYSDRSVLKSLGHWLGLLTLARNKPILMVDLDLKPLIINAYQRGQQELMYVVPFVAKVLECSTKSKVFKPPCPWTMGIMNLLAELHNEHDLKLNLKFEIEVLCKTLQVEITSLVPGTLLKDSDNKITKMLSINSFGMKPAPTAATPSTAATTTPSAAQMPPKVTAEPPTVVSPFPGLAPQQRKLDHAVVTTNASNAAQAAAAMGIDLSSAPTAAAAAAVQNLSMMPGVSAAGAFAAGGNSVALTPSNAGMAGAGMGAALAQQPPQQQHLGGLHPHNQQQGGLHHAATVPGDLAAAAAQQQSMLFHPAAAAVAVAAGSTAVAAASAAAAAAAASASASILRPMEPKFSFGDINTQSPNGLVPHIVIDTSLALLKEQPELSQLVKPALEKSISEWLSPVVDRAIKIALTTCEQLVKKDFALEADENRMRGAAYSMVRNLTAGMSMITCKDHLLVSIKGHLKTFIGVLLRSTSPAQNDAIEFAVRTIANDNVELACAFIQKKAIEKALPEIDKKLKDEYEARIRARKEGRRFCDPVALTYQAERMPEPIRLKATATSGLHGTAATVYDEFSRSVPGFKPLSDAELSVLTPKGVQNHITTQQQPQQQPPPQQQTTVTTPGVAATTATTTNTTPTPPATAATAAVPAVNNTNAPGPSIPDDCVTILAEVLLKVEPFVANCTTLPASPHMANLHALLDAMNTCRTTKETGSVLALIQRVCDNLLEGMAVVQNQAMEAESMAKYRDANLLALKAIADARSYGSSWALSGITQALVDARDDIKYNIDAFDALVRNNLVNLYDYDKHLAAAIQEGTSAASGSSQSGPCSAAIRFAMQILRIYLIEDRVNSGVIESDLFATIDVLQKVAMASPTPPDGLMSILELIKMGSERLEQNLAISGPTAQLHSGIQQVIGDIQAREFEDPPGLMDKTEYLLREWVNAYHARDAGKDSRKAFVVFVQLMNQHGILKTDDLITRFFRMSTQMCVDLCYRALSEQTNSPTLVRAKCFHTLDAYVRLITLLVKHSGETQTITKVNLLNKVLGIVAGVLLIDHEVRNTEFQQVPYHRIFIILFLELNSPDQILENINFPVLTAYCNMLHLLQPTKAPGFAYAWLEIVSHRTFMGRILAATPSQKGWAMYAQLLVDLFKFLAPFLRNAELTKPVHRLYRGTLRVLLVLLHDFPEFLCDYHYNFCDVIPPNCIQMRNLILSAFPRNMRLPDPFTPNLKVELLPDIGIAPRTTANYANMIKAGFKKDLDSYVKNRSPVSFLSELRDHLLIGNGEQPGNRYNIQMINAVVMHVGTAAINYIRAKGQTPSMSSIAHSSHMDIFQNLAVSLETEGRYLFLNCIANQLRYPNSHTHYFSCTLLYLFAEANTEAIQEQITRVLLERLIVNRPHPWGLLITFIELIKNPAFNFWNHEFVTCAPEIQKLFESVARSCMVL